MVTDLSPAPNLSQPFNVRSKELLQTFLSAPMGLAFEVRGGTVTNPRKETTHYIQVVMNNVGFTFTALEVEHVVMGIAQTRAQNAAMPPDLQELALIGLANKMLETARSMVEKDLEAARSSRLN